MTQSETLSGRCHCGGVRFTAQLAGGLKAAIRCNCSMCRMRGAVIAFAALDSLEIVEGRELLTSYRFNTGAAEHFFCARCGVYTHHPRRFDTNQYAVNTACLEGMSPFDFAAVPVVDGSNHPLDHGGGPLQVIGTLRFEARDRAPLGSAVQTARVPHS